MYKTNIIVKLEVEGLHNWPAAEKELPEVAFLSDLHRHKFFIVCKRTVEHHDRDVEIIMFKRNILAYLRFQYYEKAMRTHLFGAKSCEMLAWELVKEFDLVYCSVIEDDENGAEVTE